MNQKNKSTKIQFCGLILVSATLFSACGGDSSVNPEISSSSVAEVSSSAEIASSSSEEYSSSSSEIVYGSLIDSRDGQGYKTVVIGTQTWMAENLNYKISGSFCSDCNKYGRLYLPSVKENCPDGWHLPSNDEWRTLQSYVDLNNGSKSVSISLESVSWSGSDLFGFAALPAGEYIQYLSGGGYYDDIGEYAYFWSSTNYNSNYAYRWVLSDDNFYAGGSANSGAALSVRCLKD